MLGKVTAAMFMKQKSLPFQSSLWCLSLRQQVKSCIGAVRFSVLLKKKGNRESRERNILMKLCWHSKAVLTTSGAFLNTFFLKKASKSPDLVRKQTSHRKLQIKDGGNSHTRNTIHTFIHFALNVLCDIVLIYFWTSLFNCDQPASHFVFYTKPVSLPVQLRVFYEVRLVFFPFLHHACHFLCLQFVLNLYPLIASTREFFLCCRLLMIFTAGQESRPLLRYTKEVYTMPSLWMMR